MPEQQANNIEKAPATLEQLQGVLILTCLFVGLCTLLICDEIHKIPQKIQSQQVK